MMCIPFPARCFLKLPPKRGKTGDKMFGMERSALSKMGHPMAAKCSSPVISSGSPPISSPMSSLRSNARRLWVNKVGKLSPSSALVSGFCPKFATMALPRSYLWRPRGAVLLKRRHAAQRGHPPDRSRPVRLAVLEVDVGCEHCLPVEERVVGRAAEGVEQPPFLGEHCDRPLPPALGRGPELRGADPAALDAVALPQNLPKHRQVEPRSTLLYDDVRHRCHDAEAPDDERYSAPVQAPIAARPDVHLARFLERAIAVMHGAEGLGLDWVLQQLHVRDQLLTLRLAHHAKDCPSLSCAGPDVKEVLQVIAPPVADRMKPIKHRLLHPVANVCEDVRSMFRPFLVFAEQSLAAGVVVASPVHSEAGCSSCG
eukprot:1084921-Lingulodinium_polyedra.AAC.1